MSVVKDFGICHQYRYKSSLIILLVSFFKELNSSPIYYTGQKTVGK